MTSDLKIKSNKINPAFILAGLIIFGIVRLILIFSTRDGHHVDEVWSYGFANSYYQANVYGYDTDDCRINVDEWVKGEVFKDYITVSDDERFAYDSVLYNKRYDLSPVLYALILHTVSSLFPGSFSWYYAFSISLFFFALCVIFVYLICYEFTASSKCGILCVLYYIFSGCGTANFLYLRIYHMFTFFTLLLFYLMTKILKTEKGKCLKYYLLLPVTALLGCMTHFYFLVIAFFITGFFAIALLFKKRIRDFFILCTLMLAAVVLSFVIYPYSLNFLLPYIGIETEASIAAASTGKSSTGYYKYPYSWDLRLANIHFFGGTVGFSIDFNFLNIFEVLGIVLMLLIVLALLAFLFRNEQWMKKIIMALKSRVISIFKTVFGFAKKLHGSMYIALLASVMYLLIIPISARLYGMGYSERYFFAAMTLFLIFFFSVAFILYSQVLLAVKTNAKRIITAVSLIAITALCILSNRYIGSFKFDTMGENELISNLEGEDCYIYARFVRDMIWLSPVVAESDEVYITLAEMTEDQDYKMPELSKECLVLVASDGFISEDQKTEMEDGGGSYAVDSLSRPEQLMTLQDYIGELEKNTGYNYVCIGEYNTNIGVLSLFKPQNSSL